MGMYTELIFGASLKENTPKDVIETLQYMVGNIEKPKNLAFDTESGRNPLLESSCYFGIDRPVSVFYKTGKTWKLSTRASIKNDGEIEQFLQWIEPYIQSGSGSKDIYAYVTYEDSEKPMIHFLNNIKNRW